MTLFELRRLCRLWQKRLRITDWTITIGWGTQAEMPDACGTAQYDPRQMTAEVLIRPGTDEAYPDGGVEQTIVHELLHLVLHGDTEYERECIMQERAINQIADALYWAYRRRK
jgi:hypothetical protein